MSIGNQWVQSQLVSLDTQTVDLEGRTATYEIPGGDTSFDFTGLANGLKEDIEIADASQPNRFAFILSASSGLQPILAEDGAIDFQNEDGESVITIPAPTMSDSAPTPAVSHAASYALEPAGQGQWRMVVEADREWLDAPDRVWPVRLDPTLTLPSPHLDCTIGAEKWEVDGGLLGWRDCGSWGRKDLFAQYAPHIPEKEDDWARILLRFATDTIPGNATVSSATFGIYAYEAAQNTAGVELRQVTKPWYESVNWIQYEGAGHLWEKPGGDYTQSLGEILTSARGSAAGWWTFPLKTSVVQEGVVKDEQLSFMAKLIDDKSRECGPTSCTRRIVRFNSSAATDTTKRPYVSVVYEVPQAPGIATKAPSSVKAATATLNAGINPNGAKTSYQFEYGTTTSYGKVAPASPKDIGSGKAEVAVSEALSSLTPNTTYHYRVSATNAVGTVKGTDQTFTTLKLPSATTEGALLPSETEMVVTGIVNPNGLSTTYQFEYGTSASYGSLSPSNPTSVGAGTVPTSVAAWLTGLKAATTYHYRLVAMGPGGTAFGADKVFTTLNPPQTTIISPMPTYLSGEAPPPVQFSSSQSGSSFKCSLDEEVPKKACSSPYIVPAYVTSGPWHTVYVAATNSEGAADPTPAKYVFNTGIYPPAPATSKLTAPTEGEKTAGYYTLQAEWGEPPVGGGVTALTFQMKLHNWKEFQPVPAECVLDGKGKQVSWPLPVTQNPGHSDPVFLKVRGCTPFKNAGYPEKDIKFRAVFDGGTKAAGASEPVTTEYFSTFGGVGAPTDAAEQVGPANLDLLTGQFTISRTDVSIPVPGSEANLEFTRTYESNYRDQKAPMVLGGMWQPSAPVEQAFEGEAWSELRERHEDEVQAQYDPECEAEGYSHEECMVEEAIPAADWIELRDNEGGAAAFEIQGGNYIAPEYMKEYVLTKHVEGANVKFELGSPEGTDTVFVKNDAGIAGSFRPASISWQATAKSARLVYEHPNGTGEYRLQQMIAPAPPGVECPDSAAVSTVGCRTLTFQYLECECTGYGGWSRLSSIKYYNSSGQTPQAQVVAQYEYDSKYRLIAEWDPRISPNLKETYSYDQWYKMQSLTPSDLKPWNFGYYDGTNPNLEGLLRSVSRASLLPSPATAQTTIAYEVPISGSGAPYEMSPASVAKWGQTDYPVNATAIFPPSEVPSETPSDYDQATVSYMDPDGYVVNSASPQLPGASGRSIGTSETDRHGNVVRSLSPQSRLTALAESSESAALARSKQLDTMSTYSPDGTEMLESLGPLHKVRLESGSTVEARARTVVEYDKNAPDPKEGEARPHLPTTETTSARTPKGEDLEPRVTETHYDWPLRKPTEVIVDAATGGLKLTTRIAYDPATGLPTERSLPAKPEGGDAHTTKTVYYTKEANAQDASCGGNAPYAGLPCKTLPASQPGTAGLPELLVTRYASYNSLSEPEEIIESPNGNDARRRTIKTYDVAGREITSKQIGGGTALPPTQNVYDPDTGLPTEHKFICESECGAGFGYASSFGEAGSATGKFNHPADVAIDAKGSIWVADKANNRIEQFTEGGGSPKAFGSFGATGGKLSSPSGIAIDASGNVWVSDTGNTRIEKFNEKGEFIATFGTNVNKTKVESGGTQAEKNLCTAASGNVCQAGTAGSLGGQMKEPIGIATSAAGAIYVVEKGNSRVEKFSPTGELLAKFGTLGSGAGQLKEPTAIAGAPDGSVWVADSGNNRIQHWSSTLVPLTAVGKEGTGNGEFIHPDAIETDPAGNVLVADQGNARVQELSQSGAFIARFGASEPGPGQFKFSDPVGIAVNAKGHVWVTDTDHNQIQKWVPQAAFDSQSVTTLYDELGRPVEYFDAEGNPSSVSYDLLGRPVTTTDGKGSQTTIYDPTSGVPVALEDSAAGTFTASYDANGNMVEQGLPNGLVAKATFNEAGETTHFTYTKATNCTEKCTWLDFGAERSIYGQVLSQTSLSSTQQYSYDKAGRLTLVKDTPQGGSCTTRQYAYDADSNRTKLTTRAPGVDGACDTTSAGTPQSYSYDAADRLTDSGIVYDNFGRITSLPAKDAGGSALTTSFYSNEMVASQSQGGITNSYQLDATGRPRQVVQTGSKEGTEVFHYAGGSDAPAWTERGSKWTRNIAGIGGNLAAIQESAGETSLQLINLHGDVVATASLSPTATKLTAIFEFDEFGSPKSGNAGRFGWLGGKQRRTELPSGVIQMGVRSYVPALGRFISIDPMRGGSANAYDYSNANPVTGFDLAGTRPYSEACLSGFAGCKCKMWAKFKRGGRGRLILTTVRKCNVAGGITLGGIGAEWGKGNGSGFHSIPPPKPVNARFQAVCRPTDPCQNYQKHVREYYCEPGKEYEFSQTWEFQINLEGLPAHTLSVKIEQFCPK